MFYSLNVTLILQLVVICAYLSNFHLYCYSVYEGCIILIIYVLIVEGIMFIIIVIAVTETLSTDSYTTILEL